jgi:hypothetical protein
MWLGGWRGDGDGRIECVDMVFSLESCWKLLEE